MNILKLKEALKILGNKKKASDAPYAFKLIIWELMKTQTHVKNMDKKIKKIEKQVQQTSKDLKSLGKMDKKRDKVCDLGKKATAAHVKLPKNFGKVK